MDGFDVVLAEGSGQRGMLASVSDLYDNRITSENLQDAGMLSTVYCHSGLYSYWKSEYAGNFKACRDSAYGTACLCSG